jgi:hypothetical protein
VGVHERHQPVQRPVADDGVVVEQHRVAAAGACQGQVVVGREAAPFLVAEEDDRGELGGDRLGAAVAAGVVDDEYLEARLARAGPERAEALERQLAVVGVDDGDRQVRPAARARPHRPPASRESPSRKPMSW